MISKLVVLQAKEDKIDELSDVLKGMVEPSRAEEGCIKYDLYADGAMFYIAEAWETEASLDAHRVSDHLKNFKVVAGELLEAKSGANQIL